MARGEGNPQLENGYTPIANELLEELVKINLCAYETRVLLSIIRRTYGWHQKTVRLPLSQIVVGTGISKSHVWRALSSLVARNIVIRTPYKRIGLQEDYRRWVRKLPDRATFVPDVEESTEETAPNQVTDVTYPGYKMAPNQETFKDRKEISEKKVAPSSLEEGLLEILWSLPSWKKEVEADLGWLRELLADYPGLMVGDFKTCRDWHSEKSAPKNKGAWKARLRNWSRRVRPDEGDPNKLEGQELPDLREEEDLW